MFFSQAEKNQKAEGANSVLFAGRKEPKDRGARRKASRRRRPRCGWSGRTRYALACFSQGAQPSGRKRRAEARSQNHRNVGKLLVWETQNSLRGSLTKARSRNKNFTCYEDGSGGGPEGRRGLGGANNFAPYAFGVSRKRCLNINAISAARTRKVRNNSHLLCRRQPLWGLTRRHRHALRGIPRTVPDGLRH